MHRCRPLLLLLFLTAPLAAQDASVNPGINDRFKNPNVEEFVGRFEREGRDAFDHRNEIVEACQIKPGMNVADVGAGTGLFTRLFAPLVGDGTVYAVDIAEPFVKHVEQTAAEDGYKNVEGVVCTADSVMLPEKSVDLVFICDTYHHFEYPQKTMASIHRALKPGGTVVLIDYRRIEGESSDWILGHVRAGQEVFTAEIEAAGFRQIEERKDLLKESYFVRFEKVPQPGTP
jgi:predicted methyltransferase